MDDPEIFAKDKVRFELMRSFGWFISELSEHNAEYTPYFLKRDDQIADYDVPVDEYIRRSERNCVAMPKHVVSLWRARPFRLSAASNTDR